MCWYRTQHNFIRARSYFPRIFFYIRMLCYVCVYATSWSIYFNVNKSKTQIEFIYIFSISLYIDSQCVVDVRLLAKAISREVNDCVWIWSNMEFGDGIVDRIDGKWIIVIFFGLALQMMSWVLEITIKKIVLYLTLSCDVLWASAMSKYSLNYCKPIYKHI